MADAAALKAFGLVAVGGAVLLLSARRAGASSSTDGDPYHLATGNARYDAMDRTLNAALSYVGAPADMAPWVKGIAWHESARFTYATRPHPPDGVDVGLMGLRVRYFLGPDINPEGWSAQRIIGDPFVNAVLGTRYLLRHWRRSGGDPVWALTWYSAGDSATSANAYSSRVADDLRMMYAR